VAAGDPSLAVDASGVPHIAFVDTALGSRPAVVAMLQGGTWNYETATLGMSSYDIALTEDGLPVVAGLSSGGLLVASRGSAGWSSQTIGPGGFGASLDIDADGIPHVGHAVLNDDDLRYATTLSGAWTNDVVQNLGPGAQGPSLDISPSGFPRMTFEVRVGPNSFRAMHAFFNGTNWITSRIDSANTTDLGTSLVVSKTGVSHVVYTTAAGALRYATGVIPEPSTYVFAVIAVTGLLITLDRLRRIPIR
jgi:hypothetical protein